MAFVYKPRHQQQINSNDPYGNVNCSAYCGAILADRATMGGVVGVTGRLIRALSDEAKPDPGSPGLNLHQVQGSLAKLHITLVIRTPGEWEGFIADLKAGRGAILQGDYDQMGQYSSQPSFKGPHAIYVNHVTGDNDLYCYDPLNKRGPQEIPQHVMRKYAEKLGLEQGIGRGNIFYAISRPTPLIAYQQ